MTHWGLPRLTLKKEPPIGVQKISSCNPLAKYTEVRISQEAYLGDREMGQIYFIPKMHLEHIDGSVIPKSQYDQSVPNELFEGLKIYY